MLVVLKCISMPELKQHLQKTHCAGMTA
jgi:hypothetical protein